MPSYGPRHSLAKQQSRGAQRSQCQRRDISNLAMQCREMQNDYAWQSQIVEMRQ